MISEFEFQEKFYIMDPDHISEFIWYKYSPTCIKRPLGGRIISLILYASLFLQASEEGPVYVAEVLVNLTKESAKLRNAALIKPSPVGVLGEMQVRVTMHLLFALF